MRICKVGRSILAAAVAVSARRALSALGLMCLPIAAMAAADSCPDYATEQADYRIDVSKAPTLPPAVAKQLADEYASAHAGAAAPELVAPGLQNVILNGMSSYVTTVARAEAETYVLSRLANGWCGSDSAKNYWQSTCAQIKSIEDSNLSLSALKSSLQPKVREDLKILPACIIHRRVGTSFGYLLMNAYPLLTGSGGPATTNAMYGLATDRHLAADCVAAAASAAGDHRRVPACAILIGMSVLRVELESLSVSGKYGNDKVLAKFGDIYRADVDDALTQSGLLPAACGTANAPALCGELDAIDVSPAVSLRLAKVQYDFEALKGAIADLNRAAQAFEKAASDGTRAGIAAAFAKFAPAFAGFIADGICVVDRQCDADSPAQKRLSAYRILATAVSEVYADAEQGKYVAAVGASTPIINCLTVASTSACNDLVPALAGAAQTIEFLTVAADLAENGNIDASLQRVNSYDTQLAQTTLWVGAHLGGYVGTERDQTSSGAASGTSYGVTMPIGVGFSRPHGCVADWLDTKCFWGMSLNILDLGALASTSSASGVQSGAQHSFSQVLAPGIGVYTSLAGPFVVGLNYTYKTPGLRTASANNAPIDVRNRLALYFGIDVPFGNLPR